MSKIALIVIISLLLIWLLFTTKDNKVEKMMVENKFRTTNIDSTDIIDKTLYVKRMPPKKCIVKQKSNYITKSEVVDGHEDECPKLPITIKQFNKDFFDFRGKIENNSSMVHDPVDKINELFLDGTIWTPKPGEDIKPIADIYDELTKNVNINDDCVRIPKFDSVMYDGYMPKQVNGLYSSGNEWVYKNEKDMNGGKLDDKLYPHDNDFNGAYPLSAFPPIKPSDWAG